MGGFRLSKAAQGDLLAIGRYARERWGDERCRRYLAALDARFRALARTPEAGRVCGEIRPGYRCAREGKHVVFYRITDAGVEIVRILHERMLPKRHL